MIAIFLAIGWILSLVKTDEWERIHWIWMNCKLRPIVFHHECRWLSLAVLRTLLFWQHLNLMMLLHFKLISVLFGCISLSLRKSETLAHAHIWNLNGRFASCSVLFDSICEFKESLRKAETTFSFNQPQLTTKFFCVINQAFDAIMKEKLSFIVGTQLTRLMHDRDDFLVLKAFGATLGCQKCGSSHFPTSSVAAWSWWVYWLDSASKLLMMHCQWSIDETDAWEWWSSHVLLFTKSQLPSSLAYPIKCSLGGITGNNWLIVVNLS